MQVLPLRSQPGFAGGIILLAYLALALAVSAVSPRCCAQDTVVLVGSGSTVPALLFAKWSQEYNQRNSDVQMRYLPFGSSESIDALSHGVGDFGNGEIALSARQSADGGLIEVPMIVIGIVPIYNLPGMEGELRLSGAVLADIFLGRIKNWNSASIVHLNPQLVLPDLPIKVVYRPAGKGSNYVFSEFLSRSSVQFRTHIGIGPSPGWPVGSAAERSSDMAEKVRKEPGSIGYVETQYAATMNVASAAVLNPAGRFVKASRETLANACRAAEAPGFDRFSASLVNAAGEQSYPITSFSWLYLRTASPDAWRAKFLAEWLQWMFSSGQQIAAQEGYTILPAPLLANLKAKLDSLR
ncbi:MAG: phosphate ABC transporter substrate-binding protein PstS [Terriglobales bacterium]